MCDKPVPKPGVSREYTIAVPEERLAWIRQRVAAYRPFPAPDSEGAHWAYGVNSAFLDRFCDYLLNHYDFRAHEAVLNRYPQFLVELEGINLHYVTVRGENPVRRPLLLLHGWPGSHFEFWGIIEKLAFPSRFGGSADDAFDLVIPSLPGYGFSGPTPRPIGMITAARLFDTLMTQVLGYSAYYVQGGDWGAVIASHLGALHSQSCRAVHVNLIGFRPGPGNEGAHGEAEVSAIAEIANRERGRLAYAAQQMTRPQTLAIALMDTPVGTAAWILDKFYEWSDLGGRRLDEVYRMDDLSTNVMIYLVNGTIASSIWAYRGMAEERIAFADGLYCASPTAIARFPFEWVGATPPRSWVERYYNVKRWTEFAAGGHFASLERPDDLVGDIVAFGRQAFPAGS